MAETASASAGGEHSLIYDATKKSLFSAGACGLGWCRNHPLNEAVFQLRRVALGRDDPLPVRLFHASYYHNLAVDANEGRLYTWGCGTFVDDGPGAGMPNLDGVIPALGPRTAPSDRGEPPRPVALVPEDPANARDPIVDVSAGAYHSVVLTSLGKVYTFGAGQLGQLGRNIDNSGQVDSSGLPVDLVPAVVEGIPKDEQVVGIGAGFYNTFAIAGASRSLYGSGENQNQQCGEGPRNLRQMKRITEVTDPVDRMEGGYCHTLVRTLAGRVLSLGCGEEGQRGDGRLLDEEEEGETRDVATPVALPNGVEAVDVAAGANHSVVLGNDGRAYAFGANDVGQCGLPSRSNNDDDEEEGMSIAAPRAVELPPGAGKVIRISAGYAHTVLTTSQNKVWVFGQNDNGQLGIVTDDGEPSQHPVEVKLPAQAP